MAEAPAGVVLQVTAPPYCFCSAPSQGPSCPCLIVSAKAPSDGYVIVGPVTCRRCGGTGICLGCRESGWITFNAVPSQEDCR